MTGKKCPSPFVGSAANENSWSAFKVRIQNSLKVAEPADAIPFIRVNGRIINDVMDVKPFFKEGRAVAPVRYVAEALGRKVIWLPEENIVNIN